MKLSLNHLVRLINEKLRLYLSISLGIFLFILFFQPFLLVRFDFNNRLLFVAGFGVIVFIILYLVRLVFLWLHENNSKTENEPFFGSSISGFIILVLSSVAFAFYLRYVGLVSITFYMMVKILLICLAPPVILKIYETNLELKRQNESLILEKKGFQNQIHKYEEDILNKKIEIASENLTENLSLLIAELALLKSADNYVEIVYKEGEVLKKKLIRNTLKNIENQLRQYSNFIRCHRICIVNMIYIEKLSRNFNNYWITIKGYEEQIPVSRQYLLKLKELL
ncbi:MAG: LytTR family transcriptional regulator DNA-binding domain-containing protein [Bacteroidales bacterium]